MSYRGAPNWPPKWLWTSGAGNLSPTGEVGILKDLQLYELQPPDRFFLTIEHDGALYMGCLLFDDSMACRKIYNVLERHRGQSIAFIGGLDLPALF